MKKFNIDVHFDAVITMHGIIAETEQEAREIARRDAKSMDLFAKTMTVTDTTEEVTECQELSADEMKGEERQKVQEYVGWWMAQQTPTEVYAFAKQGARIDWLDGQNAETPEWERTLFGSIETETHQQTALYDRYARLFALQQWEGTARELAHKWDLSWREAQADPEELRVIVETNEVDPSAPDNEFGRYYMVDGSEKESIAEYTGEWHVIRIDTVESPFEVHRPNWSNREGYADNWAQLHCIVTNPNNATRWAEKMIQAGRVLDIYCDRY